MKKDEIKYGIYFLLGWNIFLLVCIHIKYMFFNERIYQILFSTAYLWYTIGWIVLCSAVWYIIGHFVRKEFVVKRQHFRETYSHLEPALVDKYYRYSYFAKYTGFLYKVALISIPVYALLRRDFFDGDFMVLVILFFIAGVFFYMHRKAKKKSKM